MNNTLDHALGHDLAALVRARSVPLVAFDEITSLPSVRRRQKAFSFDFADGTRLKGRRFKNAERAETVRQIRLAIGGGFSQILSRRGDSMLLEWIDGTSLSKQRSISPTQFHGCGEMLGALHRVAMEDVAAVPPLTLGAVCEKFQRDIAELVKSQLVNASFVRDVHEAALACQPKNATAGVIHRDFCAENLVVCASNSVVCIDNAGLAVGPHDLDLARTWWRWPMTRRDWAQFVSGYMEHRDMSEFLDNFVFWASCVLVGSAALRHRYCTPGIREPLDRLQRLIEHHQSFFVALN